MSNNQTRKAKESEIKGRVAAYFLLLSQSFDMGQGRVGVTALLISLTTFNIVLQAAPPCRDTALGSENISK